MNNVSDNIERFGLDGQTQAAAAIGCSLRNFEATLPTHEIPQFQAGSLGDQIDRACWTLATPATEGGDPTNLHRAVNLRARQAQYSLEKYMLLPQTEQPWDYLMPVYGNLFWQAVDKSFQTFVIKLAQDTYKQYVNYQPLMPRALHETTRTVPFCSLEIDDKRKIQIARHVRFAQCDEIVTVTYLAEKG